MSGFLGLYLKCIFNFIRDCRTIFKVVYNFAFLPAMRESSSCSTSSTALCILSLFYFFPFSRYILVSHCGFNLLFPNDCNILSIFSCAYWLPAYLLSWSAYSDSFPTIYWVICCKIFLCIYSGYNFYQVCIFQIFSPRLQLLF